MGITEGVLIVLRGCCGDVIGCLGGTGMVPEFFRYVTGFYKGLTGVTLELHGCYWGVTGI